MEAEDRIRRMERGGIITARQAEQLHASLSSLAEPGSKRPRRLSRVAWLIRIGAAVVALALLALAIVSLSQGGAPPVQDVSQTFNDSGAQGAMNKSILNLIAIVLFVLIPVVLLALVYNGLVNREEAVYRDWAQVESQLQRRADLVPGLMEVVSRYAQHERDTLVEVTDSRSAALRRSVEELVQSQAASARLLDDETLLDDQARMDELARHQQEVAARMRGFLALVEDYPQLRASDQFLELQAQLEGTENRINVARLEFNEAVGAYNASIRRLPGTLVAGLGSFQRKAYFQADADAAEPPQLQFD